MKRIINEADWPDCDPPEIEVPEWVKNLPDYRNRRKSYKMAA